MLVCTSSRSESRRCWSWPSCFISVAVVPVGIHVMISPLSSRNFIMINISVIICLEQHYQQHYHYHDNICVCAPWPHYIFFFTSRVVLRMTASVSVLPNTRYKLSRGTFLTLSQIYKYFIFRFQKIKQLANLPEPNVRNIRWRLPYTRTRQLQRSISHQVPLVNKLLPINL